MSRHGARQRIERNIYADGNGFAIVVWVGTNQQEIRCPPDTPIETLRRKRDQLRADLHEQTPVVERGTLAHDAERYLRQMAGRPGSKADRSHLRAWLDRLGPRPRGRITSTDVRLALAAWRQRGQFAGGRGTRGRHTVDRPASEKTLRERWRVLKHLYHTLDGPKAKTPCDDVPAPTPGASVPIGVHITVVQRVADRLKQRAAKTPRYSRERHDYARYVLLTTTGQRPAQVMRAIPEDFHLREQFWIVRGAKGGPTHAIHLNADMRAAVKLFLAEQACGAYDTQQLLDLARALGWPAGVPLYNARHSVAIDAIANGVDMSDLQALLGHASIETTRRFYAGILRMRQRAVGRALEGRLEVG